MDPTYNVAAVFDQFQQAASTNSGFTSLGQPYVSYYYGNGGSGTFTNSPQPYFGQPSQQVVYGSDSATTARITALEEKIQLLEKRIKKMRNRRRRQGVVPF